MNRLRESLHDAWTLTRPYWFSEDRWVGRGLLLAVVALTLFGVYITVLLSQWYNEFYNALQNKDSAAYSRLLVKFCWLAGFALVAGVYQLYLNQMLQIRWRRWLTERYLGAWLADSAYYRMQLTSGETDNPDQRIADDLRLFVVGALGLSIGVLKAVVTLLSFLVILWRLSGPFTLPIGSGVTVPGYLVWVALVYAGAGTWLTHLIGRPLVRLNFDQQRYEADFRFTLVRFRENTEGVALYGGEADEMRSFRERFGSVVANWWDIMRRQKRLSWFTSGYGQAAVLFPFLVTAPRYFRGEIPLGHLIQTSQAFGQVQDSLSFIISAYTDIAAWRAVVLRLLGFERALARVRAEATVEGVRHRPGADTLSLDRVSLALPGGRPLIEGASFDIRPGDTMLIGGPSGAGKSTLFRAIAGIWPFGRGEVRLPRTGRVLFLPQKPYLPIGTLREVVSYPTPPAGLDDVALRDALQAVGLPALAGRLEESAHWALALSPGEQQRIAFARALVQKPEWLFLDEATSALDEQSEAELYARLRERLPGTTVVSVGHRSTLRAFHARRLVVTPNGAGPATVEEAAPAA
jgi:putative ATP-binding cassette transporter